ncbi:hypothetical protein TRSC58_07695 [Trypanosoma rangeli SC58]|uniref:Uncharacterized protein n=1 Tax=Trypanosoma rangeli SC58 TaxID=429131 RepID=A0A061ISP0_TRYRA|nr:hypothetical protein TRSC58_07695 [Trypanosoma rangeli SC58]
MTRLCHCRVLVFCFVLFFFFPSFICWLPCVGVCDNARIGGMKKRTLREWRSSVCVCVIQHLPTGGFASALLLASFFFFSILCPEE